jgi:hypothetical protein
VILPIITDTHFGARGDSEAMQHNQAKFYDRVFFPTLVQHECKSVLHLGDYGDRRKYINFATAAFIHSGYRAKMTRYGVHETILIGNHDCYLKQSTEPNSVEELCRHTPDVTVVKDPVEIELGVPMLLLPWICDSNRERSMKLIDSARVPLVAGHLELKDFQTYRGVVMQSGMEASLFDRFKLVVSGHYHHKSSKPPVEYLGAPYAMTWNDYADPRGFHLLDTDTLELTFIENPYSIFARLVYDDDGQPADFINDLCASVVDPASPYHEAYVKVVVKQKTRPEWFDRLMDALEIAGALDILVVDDIVVNDDESETVVSLADVDTLDVIREYVESLTTSCDKPKLDAYLQGLYQEAITAGQASKFA